MQAGAAHSDSDVDGGSADASSGSKSPNGEDASHLDTDSGSVSGNDDGTSGGDTDEEQDEDDEEDDVRTSGVQRVAHKRRFSADAGVSSRTAKTSHTAAATTPRQGKAKRPVTARPVTPSPAMLTSPPVAERGTNTSRRVVTQRRSGVLLPSHYDAESSSSESNNGAAASDDELHFAVADTESSLSASDLPSGEKSSDDDAGFETRRNGRWDPDD